MLVELSQNLILMTAGAFLLGWLLSSISSSLGSRYKAKKRDARDDRIRSLEADLRVAKTDAEKSQSNIVKLEEELKETHVGIERRDNVITEQQARIDRVSRDLKESVIKTRELRAELAERATENVHAEARIREVQTELSVAQASQDMLATGILDYDTEDGDEDSEDSRQPRKSSKMAT
jgi:chromosome segregation ATPase